VSGAQLLMQLGRHLKAMISRRLALAQ